METQLHRLDDAAAAAARRSSKNRNIRKARRPEACSGSGDPRHALRSWHVLKRLARAARDRVLLERVREPDRTRCGEDTAVTRASALADASALRRDKNKVSRSLVTPRAVVVRAASVDPGSTKLRRTIHGWRRRRGATPSSACLQRQKRSAKSVFEENTEKEVGTAVAARTSSLGRGDHDGVRALRRRLGSFSRGGSRRRRQGRDRVPRHRVARGPMA